MTQLSLRLGLTRMSLLSRIAPAASTSPSFSRSIHPTHGANLEDNLQNKRSRSKRRKGVAGVAEQDEPLHTPWLEDMRVKEYENQQKRLHHEIVAYINYILPTAEEETARRQVFSCVERVIKRRFPKCSVRIFGSVASGLCLPCGDIDIVVDTREVKDDAKDKRNTLFQLSSMLKYTRITDAVQVNHHARVPIISFNTIPELGTLHVDVGINNIDGVEAIPVIKAYLNAMPALRPLIMVVKGFLSRQKLNSAANSGLGSYAITCMAISFLQLNPGTRPRHLIDKPMEAESLGMLALDFFSYYGSTFPYEDSYISVTEAKLLPKASAEWIKKTPSHKLAIQCLVRPDNDVGKSAGKIEQIRTAFNDAFVALTNPTTRFGTIIAINQTALEHREHIRNIVNSGRLATAVNLASRPGNAPQNHTKRARDFRSPYDGRSSPAVKRMRVQY